MWLQGFYEHGNEHSDSVKFGGYFISQNLLDVLHGVRRYSILVKRVLVAEAGWPLTDLFTKLGIALLFRNSYKIVCLQEE